MRPLSIWDYELDVLNCVHVGKNCRICLKSRISNSGIWTIQCAQGMIKLPAYKWDHALIVYVFQRLGSDALHLNYHVPTSVPLFPH